MSNRGLAVNGLTAGYTSIPVLSDVSITVEPGEVVALVGPNGAGKTTLLKSIIGLIPLTRGSIRLEESDLSSASVPVRVQAGIALVPEGRRLFPQMSVEDNLLMGAFLTSGRDTRARRLAEVYHLFPVLESRRMMHARYLSGGEQQMCAIGRALMGGPRLILVDEMSLGLAPKIVESLATQITRVADQGTGILLVDQEVDIALEIARRGYLLEGGRIRVEGSAVDLWGSRTIRDWYLGGEGESEPRREGEDVIGHPNL